MWLRRIDGSHDRRRLTRDDMRISLEAMEGAACRPCTVPEATRVDASRALSAAAQFLLRLDDAEEWQWFWRQGPQGEPPAPAVATQDGSWAKVVMRQHPVVYEAGPRHLWTLVEANWRRFNELGQPPLDRYFVTVTRDEQRIHLEGTDVTWTMTGDELGHALSAGRLQHRGRRHEPGARPDRR
jgi:hypothetical protein